MDQRSLERLYAYHDGELSGAERRRFEAELERSPALRDELALLGEVAAASRELDAEGAFLDTRVPDLWPDIRRGLDAPPRRPGAAPAPRPRRWWLPLGALATAAAGLASWLIVTSGGPAGVAPIDASQVAGTVRYLDTGGQAVVVRDREDATIIWLLGSDEA